MNVAPRIVHLADAPHLIDELEAWFIAEWQPYYGADGPGDARADLAACLSREALPLAVVALGPDGAPLGTATLKTESAGSDHYPGAWLAALYVAPEQRRRGIAGALIAAIETEARRLGHDVLHTSTDSLGTLLVARGWQKIATTPTLRGDVGIYRLEL